MVRHPRNSMTEPANRLPMTCPHTRKNSPLPLADATSSAEYELTSNTVPSL